MLKPLLTGSQVINQSLIHYPHVYRYAFYMKGRHHSYRINQYIPKLIQLIYHSVIRE